MNFPCRTRTQFAVALAALASTLFPVKAVRADDHLTVFELPNAVPLKTISTIHRVRAAGKSWKAFGCYPEFTASTPLTVFVGNALRERCLRDFNSAIPDLKAAEPDPGIPMTFYYQEAPQVMLYEPNHLIAVADLSDEFRGGMHDLNAVECTNFGVVNGRARALALSDFFLPGTRYRKYVEAALERKLLAVTTSNLALGGGMDWSRNQVLENFLVYPDGLVWEFNPYVAGSFGAGILRVKLTWAELGPRQNSAMRP